MRTGQVFTLGLSALMGAMALGCGQPDAQGDWTTAVFAIPADDQLPSYGSIPYPSDLWREGGHLRVPPGFDAVIGSNTEAVGLHLAQLDGYGMRPVVEFPMNGNIDISTLAGAAHVIDAEGNSVAYEWRLDETRNLISGAPMPGVVLKGGATYVAALTDQLMDASGEPVQASSDFVRLQTRQAPPAWQATADAIAAVGRDDLISAMTFTIQRGTRTMVAARALLDTSADVPAPNLAFPNSEIIFDSEARLDALLGSAPIFTEGERSGQERWGTNHPSGLAHGHVGVVATGELPVARFRRSDDMSDSPDDETFDIDESTGEPRVISQQVIPVTLILPASAPARSEGYPVVIFAHGMGSSRHAALAFAEPLTSAGYAIIAIDADGHGSRVDSEDKKNNLAGSEDFLGVAEIADGFGDRTGLSTTFDFLERLTNMSGARDAMRQSVLDLSQLVRAIKASPDLAALSTPYGGTAPRLDVDNVAFLGESFGTLLGGVLAAIEPDVDLFVLDVAGAGLIDLAIVNSPELAALLIPLATVLYRLDGVVDRFHPAVATFQSMIDAADPLTYAPHVLRDRDSIGAATGARNVVVLEVLGDEAIHNLATESLARALGLDLLSPYASAIPGLDAVNSPAAGNIDGQTGVLVQYGPAAHGTNWTSEVGFARFIPGFPHSGPEPFPQRPERLRIENPLYETLEQVIEILDTHRTQLAPVVRSTQAPTE